MKQAGTREEKPDPGERMANKSPARERRQNRSSNRKRFHFFADLENYQYVETLAHERRWTMAKIMNAILRKRPEPDEFVLSK